MKLKTLKDLTPFADITKRKNGKMVMLTDKVELKQEAIKWIKSDLEDMKHVGIDINESGAGVILKRFQKRFNITKEDLK